MRLKQIKLAGFKSFVDPTTAPFPENLTAIVGPNGCGKSNLIDAVRWVMGESSAKHLRGDSMSDVIFNGSTGRKPVAQASVELVFDNSDSTLVGEYAKYNEISTKRLVTREGQSNYYLNGTKCRRKDITDIFLGTGLGPRSYAIIEQGMISRLIESKPQELRVFIEEAAGISKYKERRRETENRIRHTRENLERLNDIREELDKQLSHLQKQANAAKKFKDLKAEERLHKAHLALLRWQTLDEKVKQSETLISQLEVELESRSADQRGVDASIEKTREEHHEQTELFNDIQGHFYSIGSDIARIEQAIKHSNERKQQLSDDLLQAKSALHQSEEHKALDDEKQELLNEELLEAEPELQMLEESMELSAERVLELEASLQESQSEWDEFYAKSADNKKQAEVLQTRITHSESVIERLQLRISKQEEERLQLSIDNNQEEINEFIEELNLLDDEFVLTQTRVGNQLQELKTKRENLKSETQKLSATRLEYDKDKKRLMTLEALQHAALNQAGKETQEFLDQKGLADKPKLVSFLDVQPGWEKALETVLASDLDAIVLQSFDELIAAGNEHGVSLSMIQSHADTRSLDNTRLNSTSGNPTDTSKTAKLLSECISTSIDLSGWLNQIYVAKDLVSAQELLASLGKADSVVTSCGIWLGQGWVKMDNEATSEQGVLEREKAIDSLKQLTDSHQEKIQTLENWIDKETDGLAALEEEWQNAQDSLNDLNQVRNQLQTKVGASRAKLEQVNKRLERIQLDMTENKQQQQEEQEELAHQRIELEQYLEAMADDEDCREKLQASREDKRSILEGARLQAKEDKEKYHQLSIRAESIRVEKNSLISNQQRIIEQMSQLQERIETLQLSQEENEEPIALMQEELELSLQKRVNVEVDLKLAREKLEEVEERIRQLDKQRVNSEQNSMAIREKLERSRVDCQGLVVQRKNHLEQIEALETTAAEIQASVDDKLTEDTLVDKLSSIAKSITRLGAINLAAIDEFQTQNERKVYLDSQHDDLQEALETLETAIRKIDKETRNRFKDTFELVNSGLQELFPKVFGGGHAYLELTGDDLLDTGVAIMARPPGKKNSTIHLLSGGEKALTALSLVFAIFRLNPAPFCMLDEVDAPLDDANVGRFCKLVKEMSQAVQFIYISHNKVSMEMARQLQGVTMHEPGVSRLVSVDIEEAAELAGV
ncbi:MAG: chromosome segregation protein SMC [Pseudomonadota bacterium]